MRLNGVELEHLQLDTEGNFLALTCKVSLAMGNGITGSTYQRLNLNQYTKVRAALLKLNEEIKAACAMELTDFEQSRKEVESNTKEPIEYEVLGARLGEPFKHVRTVESKYIFEHGMQNINYPIIKLVLKAK